MNEDTRGKFIERTTEDGIRYAIYVPENVNADTQVFTYVHGSGGPAGDWRNSQNGVLEHGSDSIIIMPTMSWGKDWGKETMTIVNSVKQEYGITNTNVSASGFSMGGFCGYETVLENIKQNPDAEPQTVFFIDDYGRTTYHGYINEVKKDEVMQAFRDNQTVFFIYEPSGKGAGQSTAYAQAGINVIRVKCIGQDHVGINKQFFYNGIYDFPAGGMLPSENYVYQVYNSETGKWEEIPYEKVATQDALYEYFNIDTFVSNMNRLYTLPDITIKSSNKALETYLNAIRRELRNTSFLTANFNEASFDSTTKVPTTIPDMITEYFTMTSSLLNSIANKTVSIARIAGEIELMDKQMASRLDNINSGDALYQIAQPIPQVPITDQITPETEEMIPIIKEEDIKEEPTTEQDTTKQETPRPQQPEKEETVPIIPVTKPESSTENTKPEQPTENNKTSQPEPPTTQEPTTEDKIPIEEDFPKYEELYSTDDKIVYNYNDEYKVVIHHEDGKITGVEHYYDYKTTEDATTAVEQLKLEYKDNENFDQVIQKDQYVKVLFKEDTYKDMTLDQFKENYKDLEEVLEPKVGE